MKKLNVFLPAVLLALVFAFTTLAQNNSAANSDVILTNDWVSSAQVFDQCEDLIINLQVVGHDLQLLTPSGLYKTHSTINGEGTDQYGGSWTVHHTWNTTYNTGLEVLHDVANAVLHGPNGAKIHIRLLKVTNGKGEVVIEFFERSCE